VKREQAHPAGGMDSVLMRVITMLGDFVGYIVDGDYPVEERDQDEKQKP
jgi:hypothetical protein